MGHLKKKRIQPKTKEKKIPMSPSVIFSIENAIIRDAIRWNCSKSWIIHSALAAFYGIDIVLPYETKNKLRRVK